MRRIPRRSGLRGSPVYEARTDGIVVRVIASYLADQSEPEEGQYLWAYMVEIENHGGETVQLVSRRWVITDALNRVEEVEGEGVVGEQPLLKPGEAFRYTSGCPLPTPSGAMRGSYRMVSDSGRTFDVDIPEFSLHLPGAGRTVN
ncbi:MAG: Co2+/Mg2+ efflux protein ApaG [Caulobacteraceae bacterium]